MCGSLGGGKERLCKLFVYGTVGESSGGGVDSSELPSLLLLLQLLGLGLGSFPRMSDIEPDADPIGGIAIYSITPRITHVADHIFFVCLGGDVLLAFRIATYLPSSSFIRESWEARELGFRFRLARERRALETRGRR